MASFSVTNDITKPMNFGNGPGANMLTHSMKKEEGRRTRNDETSQKSDHVHGRAAQHGYRPNG
jgi:hypothetical protein